MKNHIILLSFLTFLTACNQKKSTGEKDSNQIVSSQMEKTPADHLKNEFVEELSMNNISFKLHATSSGSLNTLTIQPTGLEMDNRMVEHEIDGRAVKSVIADLNNDSFPELLIFVSSVSSGAYGSIIAYSVNHGKSMSQVYFPSIAEHAEAKVGYMGHDVFKVRDNTLFQNFPIYNEGDSNANPTGGRRTVTYEMVDGEAGKRFKVVSFEDISEQF